jgi:two-component system response regulator
MLAKRILLVEDNQRDEKLTLEAFEINNISTEEIVVARDGVEALEFLLGTGPYEGRNLNEMPHLILLDLKMPRLGGLQTLQRIRADERTKMVPVVVLTSSKQEEDIYASYQMGTNSYIRKSVDFDKFLETIRKLVDYWLETNEPPLFTVKGTP